MKTRQWTLVGALGLTLAATWFGYQTLWVNRQNLPFEELGTQPTRTAQNLQAVLAFFD